ncbi:MAG: ABC transporter ATP-binding protein [Gammaproteobacteria bacterium]|nr:ABC transporter ATP-binding protein [Gammaproteobacteria bacterium]MYG66989.1 ABC transporter ATP-binding protein [Gammaproteobacteria bacterium]
MNTLLSVRDLELVGHTASGPRTLVDGLSIAVSEGESLALVGESGSGKSITALAIMGLLPEAEVTVGGGRIEFSGESLLDLSALERRRIAGNRIAMIFQEPMTSLNPVMRIGDQIVEMIRAHERVSLRAAMARAAELLADVRIPEPAMRLRAYPHQLSGGQRQRVMIAIALACRPKLLIADEPTTALDVTVQAQILALLRDLQQELAMAMLFITHDLGVVANIADRVAIMYCGQLAETGSVKEVFRTPSHPYTRGLLHCVPNASAELDELVAIPGQLPSASESLAACRFAPRCPLADTICHRTPPPTVAVSAVHFCHCHHAGGVAVP